MWTTLWGQLCNSAYKEQFDKRDKRAHQGDIRSVVIFSQAFDSKVRKSEAMARAAWKTGQISVTVPSIFMWLQLLGWTQGVGSGGCRGTPVGMEL